MADGFEREYGVAATINFELALDATPEDLQVAATFAAGDVVIMKDEGIEANTTNLPTDEGTGYSLVLTATEMQAARIMIYLIDQTATKIWMDKAIRIETYGNASAQHAFNRNVANVTLASATHTGAVIPTVSTLTGHTAQTGDSFARIGVAGAGLTNINLPNQTMDITGSLSGSVGSVTGAVGSVTAAVTLPAIPVNWITAAGVAATALNGKGDWNIGKTGYSLTQAFPANFADMAITVTTGQMTVGTNNDKTGYDLSAAAVDAVWDENIVLAHTTADTSGRRLADAGAGGDPWATALPEAYTAGQAGQIVGDNINATVSSRMAEISINTTAGAVDTVTTNTDMRGTDGANTTIPLSAAQVNAEVVDVIRTDVVGELASVPAASSSLMDKINWLFMMMRNKNTQTSTLKSIRNDGDTASVATAVVSSDGTTTTRDEYI